MIYLLLDTSTPICRATVVKDGNRSDYEWQADRNLAHGLLEYLTKILKEHDADLSSLSGIGVLRGPGSFTGLRIGLTVVNTVADSQSVPIVGADGDDWQNVALNQLNKGQNDKVVLPLYGREARITNPRK